MQTTTFRYLGASVIAALDAHGVLTARFSGAVTAGALDALKAMLYQRYSTVPVAVVADYSRATLALGDDAMWAMMACRAAKNLPALPAAVVSPHINAMALKKHALNAAVQSGVRRVVLTCPVAASSWAHQQQPEIADSGFAALGL